MCKHLVVLLMSVGLFGCSSMSSQGLYGTTAQDKCAELKYTHVGMTSDFELAGIATGTYKCHGHEAGLIAYAGAMRVDLTVDAAEKWSIHSECKRQSYSLPGVGGLRLHNPYVGEIRMDGQVIGTVGISMPKIDGKSEVLKHVGLDSMVHRNLELSGAASILGAEYRVESVYRNQSGKPSGSPYGYKVLSRGQTLGLVQVGKNVMGGQKLKVWVRPGLAPKVEQSVVSVLLVCGYAI